MAKKPSSIKLDAEVLFVKREQKTPIISKPKETVQSISYLSLFRDTSTPERILMILGVASAFAAGTGSPSLVLSLGI